MITRDTKIFVYKKRPPLKSHIQETDPIGRTGTTHLLLLPVAYDKRSYTTGRIILSFLQMCKIFGYVKGRFHPEQGKN